MYTFSFTGNERSKAAHTRFREQGRVCDTDTDQSIGPIDITSWNKMAGGAMLRTLTGIILSIILKKRQPNKQTKTPNICCLLENFETSWCWLFLYCELLEWKKKNLPGILESARFIFYN